MTVDEIEEELEELGMPTPELQQSIGSLYNFACDQSATREDKTEAWLYGQWCGGFHLMKYSIDQTDEARLKVMDHLVAIGSLLHRLGLPRADEFVRTVHRMHYVANRIIELETLKEAAQHPSH